MSGFLRISQYDGDALTAICDVIPVEGDAAQMITRLRRIFGDDAAALAAGALWIERHESTEDLTDERVVIRAAQGEWLLGSFFRLPRTAWRAFRNEAPS